MQLSEAIRIGSQLRGESHSGPFTRIANTDELRSDVWGAACEAVHSLVAKRNWNHANPLEYDSDIEYLRGIQQQYFAHYFKMPATCPGARPRIYSEGGGRLTGRTIGGLADVAIEGERQQALGAITSDCARVINVAEFIEHAFYVHNWSREQCAEAVQFIEQGSIIQLVQSFDHYHDLSSAQRISTRLNAMMNQRQIERHQRRTNRRAYFTS